MKLQPSHLREIAVWEYAVRFAFGGALCVLTGIVGARWATYAGMLMAFPAILPASVTLVKKHDGRERAEEDARGGRIGVLGLAAFATVVAIAAGSMPAPLVLALATLAWAAVAVGAWLLLARE
ncbi:MAG TPA: hypothetical protein VH143_23710 [Kofleriaceae bacterium]|nr:hypothetical protein [Kofleriaceae bacterium]